MTLKLIKFHFNLSNYVWDTVISNGIILLKIQLVLNLLNAVDSISANIAEGFGRYSKKR